MKYLLFLFFFAATYLQAQDSVRVTLYPDSVYLIENIYNDDAGIPARVDIVKAIGTTELTNYFTGLANQAFTDYEQASRRYRETERFSRRTIETVNAHFAMFGLPSYFDQTATAHGAALMGDYTYTAPGITGQVITVNANLRFNPGTGVHQIRILKPGFLRILQGGVLVTELFLLNRRYTSFDGRYTLRTVSAQGQGK